MDPRITHLQKEAAERRDVIGLAGGLPADDLLPRDALARALSDVTASRDDALQYGWPEGTEQVRGWIVARLAARGAAVDPDRVIVTAGAQQALAIAGAVLADHAITVGDAAYPGALDAFRNAGATVVARGGDVTYVMAGVANPLGRELPHPDAGTLIVDEAYAELRFDGRLPALLVGAAADRVWHVGTISKTIAPGLRVGWLIPPPAHHEQALQIKQATDLQTASISQAALGRLVHTIDYDALLATARAAYADRAGRVIAALRAHTDLEFAEPEGGFSIWAQTHRAGDELALLQHALDEGVMIDPGSLFQPSPAPEIAMRLSFSSVALDHIDEAARRLARAVARWRRATS